MFTQNKISKICLKILFLGILFCVFSTTLSYGQKEAGEIIAGEQDKEVSYHPHVSEKQLDKPSEKSEKRSFSGYSRADKDPDRSVYQDISDKEIENGETSSEEGSTLSFNIFLYVLDRFKED
ncbi:hypothetical protein [Cyclobacterium salsum]|uniref:hypothetical protein n=1 Tax=Cyclobacterium salsum TaxID=2666329 RepID=UPI0013910290|nr:hypothetical protein [Cyclobacterium salsum]